MQVVYGDVLFLINFCMDLIALNLCGLLLHARRRRLRLLIAAAIGGVYSVASVFFEGSDALTLLLSLAVAAVICAVAYDFSSLRRFFSIIAAFFSLSFALGGAITALYQLLARLFKEQPLPVDFGGRMTLFIVISALASVLVFLIQRALSKMTEHTVAELLISIGDKSKRLSALLDSGNLLRDPAGGTPAIVLRLSSVTEILPADIRRFAQGGMHRMMGNLSSDSMRRIRLIPAGGIGKQELLLGVRADSIRILTVRKNGKTEEKEVEAILALSCDNDADLGEFDAIAPASLAA